MFRFIQFLTTRFACLTAACLSPAVGGPRTAPVDSPPAAVVRLEYVQGSAQKLEQTNDALNRTADA